MASIYDFGDMGIPAAAQSLTNLYTAFSQDRLRKEQINEAKIQQRKALADLEKEQKEQELLGKTVMFRGMMEAKGASPRVIDRTIKGGQALGLLDNLGNTTVRNMQKLKEILFQDPEYQRGIIEDGYADAGEKIAGLQDEIDKLLTVKDQDPEKAKEYQTKIMEREKLRFQMNTYQNMMDKLTGAKTDTSRTKDEILTGDPNSTEVKNYIANTQRIGGSGGTPTELQKLQSHRAALRAQGIPDNDPEMQEINMRIRTLSGLEQTQNQKEMSELRKETQEFKIQQKRAEAENAYDGMDLSMDRMIQQAEGLKNNKALSKITGVMGVLPDYPGGEAAYARAQQRNLISMMRMDTMTTLRAMSKTGGLVGNVSDAEGKVFETYIANLENKIGTEDFKSELNKVINYAKGIKTKLANAYKTQFPDEAGRSTTPPEGYKNTGKTSGGKAVWVSPDGKSAWVAP